MPVVINEFEVVPGDTQPQQKAAVSEGGSSKNSPSSEHELERLVEHQMIRCERVWAH